MNNTTKIFLFLSLGLLTLQQDSFGAVKANIVIGADGKQHLSLFAKAKKAVLAPQNRMRVLLGIVSIAAILGGTIFGVRWWLKNSAAKNEPTGEVALPPTSPDASTTPVPDAVTTTQPDGPVQDTGSKPQQSSAPGDGSPQPQNAPPQINDSSQPQSTLQPTDQNSGNPSQPIDQNDEKLTSPAGATQVSAHDSGAAASEEPVPEVLRKALAPVYDALPMNKEPLDGLDAKLKKLQENKEPPAEITNLSQRAQYRDAWSDAACQLYDEKIARLAPKEGQSFAQVANNLQQLCALPRLEYVSGEKFDKMQHAWRCAVNACSDKFSSDIQDNFDVGKFEERCVDANCITRFPPELENYYKKLASLQLQYRDALDNGQIAELASRMARNFKPLGYIQSATSVGGFKGCKNDDAISIMAKLALWKNLDRPSFLNYVMPPNIANSGGQSVHLEQVANDVFELLWGLRAHVSDDAHKEYVAKFLETYQLPQWLQDGAADVSKYENLVSQELDFLIQTKFSYEKHQKSFEEQHRMLLQLQKSLPKQNQKNS